MTTLHSARMLLVAAVSMALGAMVVAPAHASSPTTTAGPPGLTKIGDTVHASDMVQERRYHVHMDPTDCAAFRQSKPEFAKAMCDFNMGFTVGAAVPGPAPTVSSRTGRFSAATVQIAHRLSARSLHPRFHTMYSGCTGGWCYTTVEVYICDSQAAGCSAFYSRVYQYLAWNGTHVYAQSGTNCIQMGSSANMHISLISPTNWCGHQNYNSDANLSAGDNVHIWGTLPTPFGNISTVDFQEQQRMYVDRYADVSVWASTSSLVKVGCWADGVYASCN